MLLSFVRATYDEVGQSFSSDNKERMSEMKQRLLLCLLLALALMYFALPNLPIFGGGIDRIFAYSWLLFCLFVIGGNLSGLLYSIKRADIYKKSIGAKRAKQEKIRQYS